MLYLISAGFSEGALGVRGKVVTQAILLVAPVLDKVRGEADERVGAPALGLDQVSQSHVLRHTRDARGWRKVPPLNCGWRWVAAAPRQSPSRARPACNQCKQRTFKRQLNNWRIMMQSRAHTPVYLLHTRPIGKGTLSYVMLYNLI